MTDAGEVLLRGMTSVPADQRWFWGPDWQAGEREASEQIKAGDGSGAQGSRWWGLLLNAGVTIAGGRQLRAGEHRAS